ncbi:LOG family protein [Tuwongella immobilis]|uniref:AMP nucleosidase n=1 Tax=Tuwongella immobilis TaxID=692036 RepID=A0A6C2YKC4_9BACT|nr:LOG family protein [Tuwongella immobilis]VIP02030.1 Uncharacterized protein OS=Blastopirellula marina DSM 3645 GN=DSM3645_15945 PE=4 SV=1: Lysine_decarbox [Tuwongella immobilis]VTS00177.1 Uncharacterized protein OS=Blastopirellula marina DSM 3645 GN=DSM3645_15945 PE=4 SV=1: Lysine_decarbox [Tuwongella immobilis]
MKPHPAGDEKNPILDPEPESANAPLDPHAPDDISDLVAEMHQIVDKLVRDHASRGDVKLLRTALAELRYSFKVFAGLKSERKVSIFGSARTRPEAVSYQQALEFGRKISEQNYLVITGAASGIMEAGHRGAGRDNSIGLNIMLPFEQRSNDIIHGDPKLMHLKYFFTRKLLFMKESDAVVLFPGGFGTHDEGFEVLTLVQTGKSQLVPIVLVEEPGGSYWQRWRDLVEDEMLTDGMISPMDKALYKITESVDEAVEEVTNFYRVYHSMRYIRKDLVLRLQRPISDATLERIRREFQDIVAGGTFELVPAHPSEANEPALRDLPRLRFRFDRHAHGRLRMLIDVLNQDGR